MSLSITAKRTMVAALLTKVSQSAEKSETFLTQPFIYIAGANFSQKHILYFSFGDEKFRADVSRIDEGLLEIGRFQKSDMVWIDGLTAQDKLCLALFDAAAKEFGDWLFAEVRQHEAA